MKQKNLFADTVLPSASDPNQAKPISNLPKTLGRALDVRLRVEKRIKAIHNAHQQKNPFWNTISEPLPADEIVQSILDRHQVLFQLNEIIGATSALKNSTVIVPAFLPDCPSYSLSLSQLRDAESVLLPYLTQIHDTVMAQMSDVASQCNQHDTRVEQDLKDEYLELERQFKIKSEKAKQYSDIYPNEDDLKADKAVAARRAETKKAVRVDVIGVRDFIGTLRPFISLLQEKRNDKIDACNAESIDHELESYILMISKATQNIRNGVQESYPSNEDKKEDELSENISATDLTSNIIELSELLNNAIPCISVVSYRKGQDAKLENSQVESGNQWLVEIFQNIHVLMQYKQAHREVMNHRFTALHPLNQIPCSLDAMVRLGYDSADVKPVAVRATLNTRDWNNSRNRGRGRGGRGRGTRSQQHVFEETEDVVEDDASHPSLFLSLTKLEVLLNAASVNMDKEKEVHELAIRKSISDKQEARSKSGAVLKGTELEEISKAVRASDATDFYLSKNIEIAKERVAKLLEEVQSLQSAERKSANAVLRVTVPRFLPMRWVKQTDEFNGW